MTLATTNGADAQAEAETNRKMLDEMARIQRVAELRARDWTVDLSNGQRATLVDPDVLPERKARAMKVAMVRCAPDGKTLDPDASVDAAYVTVAVFLASWSLPGILPTAGAWDSLLDLSAKDFGALDNAVADVRREAFPDFTVTPEALQDPSSPFGAASA